jgi:SAM-dependent methyltransferase
MTNDRHRELVGGLWDEIGSLQVAFLVRQGLRPSHTLLDVGCGCLRGGIHFVRYLDQGHYFGIDADQSLLDAGYDVELARAGLTGRLPRHHLRHSSSFDVSAFGVTFDYALAQSVFTHLGPPEIVRCLEAVSLVVRSGGTFFATFFEVPEGFAGDRFRHDPGGVVTSATADPFHYRWSDMMGFANGLPWRAERVVDWAHPRAQRMVKFART